MDTSAAAGDTAPSGPGRRAASPSHHPVRACRSARSSERCDRDQDAEVRSVRVIRGARHPQTSHNRKGHPVPVPHDAHHDRLLSPLRVNVSPRGRRAPRHRMARPNDVITAGTAAHIGISVSRAATVVGHAPAPLEGVSQPSSASMALACLGADKDNVEVGARRCARPERRRQPEVEPAIDDGESIAVLGHRCGNPEQAAADHRSDRSAG